MTMLRRVVWASCTAAATWALAGTVAAAAQTRTPAADAPDPRSGEVAFRIAAQPIDGALREFASQANLQLIYETTEVSPEIRSPHVAGEFTPEAALVRLLAHTNLGYKFVNNRTVSIRTADAASASRAGAEEETVAQSPASARAPQQFVGSNSGELVSASGVDANGNTELDARNGGRKKGTLDEVVVTASKRAELLSKAPLAVSSLNMDQLQDSGIVAVKDLTSVVPDLQIHTIGVDGFVGITIRGISNLDYSGMANPAVSTYIDGTYIGLSQGFASDLYDIERVEVLRGPQGTLYGRNATGGNLNIITADPKNVFSASADASFGNYNDVLTHGMVNVPVSDELQIRAAVMSHRNDGYFDTAGTTARNYGASDDFGGRVTALWRPVQQFKWRLSFDEFIVQGTPWASIQTGEDGKPANGRSPYHQPTGADPEPENYIRNFAIRSRMDWLPSDSVDVAYIAGYQKLNQHYYWATTGQAEAPENTAFEQFVQYSATFQSHEIDVNYESKRLKNVFGGSYFGQRQPNGAQAGIFPILGYDFTAPDSDSKSRKDAWGVFDQATYSLTDRWRFTGGVRYSREKQVVAAIDYIFCPVLPDVSLKSLYATAGSQSSCGPLSVPSASGSWSSTTWRAGLDFDISDRTLGYLSATSGFKSGGVQPGLPASLPETFKPENVKNYEFGVKTRFLEGALNLRAAVFYEDYTDLQVFQQAIVPDLGFVTVTTNAAKAGIYGTELESEWRLSDSDHIQGFANFLHAKYKQFDNAYDSRTGTSVPSLSGNQLPNAPQESFRFQYSHDFSLGDRGTLTPLAAVYWQSTSYLQSFNTSFNRQSAYSKTNLNLTYMDASGRWKVAGYVENLEFAVVKTSNYASVGNVYSDYAPPRTFGIRVSYAQ